MRILLLSAYDAASHRQWRTALVANLPEHDWTVLTLPDRFFSWRIRGNALSWVTEQQALLQQDFDLIVATSMVDLATLKGIQSHLASIPALLYFHENQFAYPESEHARINVEAQITSIYSAMAAERILFNSAYNRDTFLLGAVALLKKMPDHAPISAIKTLADKSSVLAVPIADECFYPVPDRSDQPLTLLWNHRWEYDKGPDRLYFVLKELAKHAIDFKIHIIGQQFRKQPEIFNRIHEQFQHHILSWGYIESRQIYLQVLQQSDIVISTAQHDFQGIAILEAVACGCIPVVPNRLAYPDFIPDHFRSDSFDDAKHDAASIASSIISFANQDPSGWQGTPDLSHLSWSDMIPLYKNALQLRPPTIK